PGRRALWKFQTSAHKEESLPPWPISKAHDKPPSAPSSATQLLREAWRKPPRTLPSPRRVRRSVTAIARCSRVEIRTCNRLNTNQATRRSGWPVNLTHVKKKYLDNISPLYPSSA